MLIDAYSPMSDGQHHAGDFDSLAMRLLSQHAGAMNGCRVGQALRFFLALAYAGNSSPDGALVAIFFKWLTP